MGVEQLGGMATCQKKGDAALPALPFPLLPMRRHKSAVAPERPSCAAAPDVGLRQARAAGHLQPLLVRRGHAAAVRQRRHEGDACSRSAQGRSQARLGSGILCCAERPPLSSLTQPRLDNKTTPVMIRPGECTTHPTGWRPEAPRPRGRAQRAERARSSGTSWLPAGTPAGGGAQRLQ